MENNVRTRPAGFYSWRSETEHLFRQLRYCIDGAVKSRRLLQTQDEPANLPASVHKFTVGAIRVRKLLQANITRGQRAYSLSHDDIKTAFPGLFSAIQDSYTYCRRRDLKAFVAKYSHLLKKVDL